MVLQYLNLKEMSKLNFLIRIIKFDIIITNFLIKKSPTKTSNNNQQQQQQQQNNVTFIF